MTTRERKKGAKQLTAALQQLHEFLGDGYIEGMRACGFQSQRPMVGWYTELKDGQPATRAVLLWEEPWEPEEIVGVPVDMLVHEVCSRAIRRLHSVASN